jgi:hypothetical protein
MSVEAEETPLTGSPASFAQFTEEVNAATLPSTTPYGPTIVLPVPSASLNTAIALLPQLGYAPA